MGDIKNYSPFYKVRKTLKFLRATLGFPLKISNESFTEFTFVTWLEVIRFFIIYVIPVILHSYLFVLFMSHDGNLDRFWRFYESIYTYYSMSIVDDKLEKINKRRLERVKRFCSNQSKLETKSRTCRNRKQK